MIRNRFIVVSALQALGAAEARHALDLSDDECELVLLVPPVSGALDAVRAIVRDSSWAQVREAGPPADTALHWCSRVIRHRGLRSESAGLDRIFLGDYQNQIGRNAAHGLDDGDIFVLDDGTATVLVNEYRKALAENREPPSLMPQVSRGHYRMQALAARALGLRLDELQRVTYFTIYPLSPSPPDTVIRHRFDWLRSRFGNPELVDGTLFLGSPLVEAGIVNLATYREMLSLVRESTDGRLWYRAHPREAKDKVEELCERYDFELLHGEGIIEWIVAEQRWMPRRVVGNFSTALDTLRVLGGSDASVESIELPQRLVASHWWPRVKELQESVSSRMEGDVSTAQVFANPDADAPGTTEVNGRG